MHWLGLLVASSILQQPCWGLVKRTSPPLAFVKSVSQLETESGVATFQFTDDSGATGTATFYDAQKNIYLDGVDGVVDIQCVWDSDSASTQVTVTFDTCDDVLNNNVDSDWHDIVVYTSSLTSGCFNLPSQFEQIVRFPIYGNLIAQTVDNQCTVTLSHDADLPTSPTKFLLGLDMRVQRPVAYNSDTGQSPENGQFYVNQDLDGTIVADNLEIVDGLSCQNCYVSLDHVKVVHHLNMTFEDYVIVDVESSGYITHKGLQMGIGVNMTGLNPPAMAVAQLIDENWLSTISFMNVQYGSSLGLYVTMDMDRWGELLTGVDLQLMEEVSSVIGVHSKRSRIHGLSITNRDTTFSPDGKFEFLMYTFLDLYARINIDASAYDASLVWHSKAGIDFFMESLVTFHSRCRYARTQNTVSVRPFYDALSQIERLNLDTLRPPEVRRKCIPPPANNLMYPSANYPNKRIH